jgi:hypothetical protein
LTAAQDKALDELTGRLIHRIAELLEGQLGRNEGTSQLQALAAAAYPASQLPDAPPTQAQGQQRKS